MPIIIKQQDQTSVFANEDGGITISQRCADGGEVFITIEPMHVPLIVRALNVAKKLAQEDD